MVLEDHTALITPITPITLITLIIPTIPMDLTAANQQPEIKIQKAVAPPVRIRIQVSTPLAAPLPPSKIPAQRGTPHPVKVLQALILTAAQALAATQVLAAEKKQKKGFAEKEGEVESQEKINSMASRKSKTQKEAIKEDAALRKKDPELFQGGESFNRKRKDLHLLLQLKPLHEKQKVLV